MRDSLAAAVLCCFAGSAFADDANFAFNISGGDATFALAQYARQSKRQIIANGDTLTGLKVRPLEGSYSAEVALRLLLQGTGLAVASDDGHTIILVRAPEQKPAAAASIEAQAGHQKIEAITVSGYRASLVSAINVKRSTNGVIDAVFAEDIGKFPDSNLAASLNRVPGTQLTRDANGEGVQVAIRGLGTDFTKILLNGAPIAVATPGIIDVSNNNREVDLNIFPSEMFTSLTVYKTPRPELVEGGIAGTVDMRTRRPFDQPGPSLTYIAQGIDNTGANGMGGNAALIASNTWNTDSVLGEAGILIGLSYRHTLTYTRGWEDGNAGWVTPSITNTTLCGSSSGCDLAGSTETIGGNSIILPATVPANVSIPGYASGTTVTAAMLLALNPGLTMRDISNMLLPRLPRRMYQRSSRDRYNALISLEFRPIAAINTYIDVLTALQQNDSDRSDMGWGVRVGDGAQPIIPIGVSLDGHGVVTSGTFANSQFGLEARHYMETADFIGIGTGLKWSVTDRLILGYHADASRSHFLQRTPGIMLVTCPSAGVAAGVPSCTAPQGGVWAKFTNLGGAPTVETNIDLNDPANFQWSGGRAQLRDDKRYGATYGSHLTATYDADSFRLEAGLAYDVFYRSLAGIDLTYKWQSLVCGSGQACTGGTGSLIPAAAIANYLRHGPEGFVALDYAAFEPASGMISLNKTAIAAVTSRCAAESSGTGFSINTMTGGEAGCFEERNAGGFLQIEGSKSIRGRIFSYAGGFRWIETRQSIRSPAKMGDGSYIFSDIVSRYDAILPSASFSYEVEDAVVRLSLSRNMTRAAISTMINLADFADITAQELPLGSPNLRPYFSNNIDLGMEYYTGNSGYFSIDIFHKWISGFTTVQIVPHAFSFLAQYGYTWQSLTASQQDALQSRYGCTSDSNCNAVINIRQTVNTPGIEAIRGIEFAYNQPLDFLLAPYGVPGIGLTANLTLTGQSSSALEARRATGIAAYSYNLTSYYEHAGIMLRLSYAFTDKTFATSTNQQNVCLPSTQSLSTGCPEGAYIFSAPYGQADISASLKMSRLRIAIPGDPELTLNVQNLFNAKRHTYFQYENAYHNEYAAGHTIIFGVRGTL